MCGIVGLYLKKTELQIQLGKLFKPMLVEMSSRGPDSAGVAIYRNQVKAGQTKFSLAHIDPGFSWKKLGTDLAASLQCDVSIKVIGTHCILVTDTQEDLVVKWLNELKIEQYAFSKKNISSKIRIVGSGQSIEIFKETGSPEKVYEQFNLSQSSGTHMIGHTRMATESAVPLPVPIPSLQVQISALFTMAHFQITILSGGIWNGKESVSRQKMTQKSPVLT